VSEPLDVPPLDSPSLDAAASVLMKQGIRLMHEPGAGPAAEALGCFDRALEIRRGLPIDDVPLFRYGLAACLLNRADALVRLGGGNRIENALSAYDEGIEVMRGLRLGDDPRFPRRLAIAHQNRGLALLAHGRVAGAVASFTAAIAVLEDDQSAAIPDRPYLLAAVTTNLASAHAAAGTAESDSLAREAARRAMAMVADAERDDADSADVGLQARHVLCRLVAERLAQPSAGTGAMPEDVHEATDAVDEGLDLVRRWERQGSGRFRTLACDLFRFGARVYAIYQPQFLEEFVADNVDPARSSREYVDSAEMRAAAEEALGLRR
jgi:tetratricopeptide (TPR) repeat protein